ncbi:MAG: tryptophan-rich sensory protein [Bacteroidota bacterium]
MPRIYPVLTLLLAIVINFLANFLPIGGRTTGEVSDSYPTFFTPAGFTFSIWGLIYFLLLTYVIYQFLAKRTTDPTLIDKINRYFVINSLANTLWILAWHFELITISLILMGVILYTVISIYRRIYKYGIFRFRDKLFIRLPFSVYLGWITVATLANLSVEQTVIGMDNWFLTRTVWVFVELGLAGAIAVVMIIRYRDPIFAGVIAWAAYGISQKQTAVPEVAGAAAAVMILVLVVLVVEGIRKVVWS